MCLRAQRRRGQLHPPDPERWCACSTRPARAISDDTRQPVLLSVIGFRGFSHQNLRPNRAARRGSVPWISTPVPRRLDDNLNLAGSVHIVFVSGGGAITSPSRLSKIDLPSITVANGRILTLEPECSALYSITRTSMTGVNQFACGERVDKTHCSIFVCFSTSRRQRGRLSAGNWIDASAGPSTAQETKRIRTCIVQAEILPNFQGTKI